MLSFLKHHPATGFLRQPSRYSPLVLLVGLMARPCAAETAADFLVLGSYFPSWLIGAILAVPLTIALRYLLLRTGIDDFLPWRFLVYICFWLIFSMAFTYIYGAS